MKNPIHEWNTFLYFCNNKKFKKKKTKKTKYLILSYHDSKCVFLLYIVAVQEQRAMSATAIGSTVGDSSPPDGMLPKDKAEDRFEPLGLQIQHIPLEVERGSPTVNPSLMETGFHLEDGIKMAPSVEHQFIPSFTSGSPLHQNNLQIRGVPENLSSLRSGCDEDICVSLHLGDNDAKRRRSEASTSTEEPK
jgi:hypothetical protein